jgi:predicted nucleotidyltransferase
MEEPISFTFPDFTIDRLIQSIDIPEDEIINCYLCGSRVYGTFNAESDWDFVSVVKDGFFGRYPSKPNLIENNFISSSLFEKEKWEKMLVEVRVYFSVFIASMIYS